MHRLIRDVVDDANEVVDEKLGRQRKIPCDGPRPAEPALVDADHAIPA
jgi:hypothetical protein